jgi:hypothetical protein
MIMNTQKIAAGLNTGHFGEVQKDLTNWIASVAPDKVQDLIKATTGLDPAKDASAWQELAKLTLQMSGDAGSAVAGGHTGYNLVSLYQKSFPGLDTQPQAMHDMLNLFLVQHQFNIDHAEAGAAYYGAARQANLQDPLAHPYTPMSVAVDKPFLETGGLHAPQVYVAAAAILNNHPQGDSFAGLTQAQQVQAVRIAASVNPSMVYNGARANAAAR